MQADASAQTAASAATGAVATAVTVARAGDATASTSPNNPTNGHGSSAREPTSGGGAVAVPVADRARAALEAAEYAGEDADDEREEAPAVLPPLPRRKTTIAKAAIVADAPPTGYLVWDCETTDSHRVDGRMFQVCFRAYDADMKPLGPAFSSYIDTGKRRIGWAASKVTGMNTYKLQRMTDEHGAPVAKKESNVWRGHHPLHRPQLSW